jgi:hypothetical protein
VSRNIAASPQNNPYYSLRIFQQTETRVTVTQTNELGQVPYLLFPMGVYILRCKSPYSYERYEVLNGGDIVAGSGHTRQERIISFDTVLQPGRYVILAALLDPDMESFFTMTVLTDQTVECSQLWPPTTV